MKLRGVSRIKLIILLRVVYDMSLFRLWLFFCNLLRWLWSIAAFTLVIRLMRHPEILSFRLNHWFLVCSMIIDLALDARSMICKWILVNLGSDNNFRSVDLKTFLFGQAPLPCILSLLKSSIVRIRILLLHLRRLVMIKIVNLLSWLLFLNLLPLDLLIVLQGITLVLA